LLIPSNKFPEIKPEPQSPKVLVPIQPLLFVLIPVPEVKA
jgi:hypothetical protein